jgi:membrane protein DedA with SNARE-associated domain
VHAHFGGRVKNPSSVKAHPRLRKWLLGLAVVRMAIGLIAIPLAPFLYREHFVVLVLMRPTKEVLLAGGFLWRLDRLDPIPLVAASLPLAVLGVWQFYYLGRQYADKIASGKLPGLAGRVLRPDRIKTMQRLLKRKGPRLVFLGRLAAFPSTVVATAAGSGDMPSRKFLPADGAGATLSIVEVVGAGFLLGETYDEAGPWITAVGVAVLVAVAVIVARFLRRA